MTILVISVSFSKLAECVHAAFTSVEKHCPVLFSLAYSSFSRNIVCKKGTPLGKTEWIFLHKLKLRNVSKTKQNFSGEATGHCLLPFSSYRQRPTFLCVVSRFKTFNYNPANIENVDFR